MSGEPTPDVIVEPVVSKVTKVWTTVFARKIIGRQGEIIGFAVRGVEPSHFENFVASLALDSDTAISMIHRDGTVIARYPKDDKLIGLERREFGRRFSVRWRWTATFRDASPARDCRKTRSARSSR